jgi:hypothetical protein
VLTKKVLLWYYKDVPKRYTINQRERLFMKNLTLGAMKEMNEKAGQQWFSKSSMKFFGTIIEVKPNVKDIFITSEWKGFDTPERGYTLRRFDRETGKVETLGDLNQYSTLESAREARKQY